MKRTVARLFLWPVPHDACGQVPAGYPPPGEFILVRVEQDQEGVMRDGEVRLRNGDRRVTELTPMTRLQLADLMSQGAHLLAYQPGKSQAAEGVPAVRAKGEDDT